MLLDTFTFRSHLPDIVFQRLLDRMGPHQVGNDCAGYPYAVFDCADLDWKGSIEFQFGDFLTIAVPLEEVVRQATQAEIHDSAHPILSNDTKCVLHGESLVCLWATPFRIKY